MTKRAKKQVIELITREQCEEVIQDYAEAGSQIKGIESYLEQRIQSIREEKAQDLLTHIPQNSYVVATKLVFWIGNERFLPILLFFTLPFKKVDWKYGFVATTKALHA